MRIISNLLYPIRVVLGFLYHLAGILGVLVVGLVVTAVLGYLFGLIHPVLGGVGIALGLSATISSLS